MERFKILQKEFVKAGQDALLVSYPTNRNYLSGFTGSDCMVLVTPKRGLFITDFRYQQQAYTQCAGFEVEITRHGRGYYQIIKEYCIQDRVKVLAFEPHHLTMAQYTLMKNLFKGSGINLAPEKHSYVEHLRQIKDLSELKLIQKSNKVSMEAFEKAVSLIKLGVYESDVSIAYGAAIRASGASGESFETILASGPRSAMPHGVASRRKMKKGDFVVFDFGALVNRYCSDCTRTFVIGKPSIKQKEIYSLVLEAQLSALAAVKPGVMCSAVDDIARKIITSAGYGSNFGHGLGHGVGMDIHESPRLNNQDKTILKPGMVVTVEPGIYLEGWGGVRIEDLVIVTEKGCKVLTQYSKELISL